MKSKTWNRLLSGILCLVMLFSAIPAQDIFVVAQAEETSAMSVPEVKESIWYEQFEDAELNGNWTANSNYTNGSYTVDTDNQVFRMTRSVQSDDKLYQDVYFGTESTDFYKGVYGLEIEFKRSSTAKVKFRIDGTETLINDSCTASGRWDLVYYTGSVGGTKETVKNSLGTEPVKLTYLFNTVNSTVSVWVNDELKVTSGYTAASATDGLNYMRISLNGNAGDTLEIDNIRFYKSYPMTAAERLALDEAWLTQDMLVAEDDPSGADGQISSNLTLPSTGDNLSAITWTSSNTSVISDDGQVTCGDEVTEVTMTAEIKSTGLDGSEATDTKTFTFSVAAKAVSNNVSLPELKTLILEELFTDNVAKGNWSESSFANGKGVIEDEVYRITRSSDDTTSGTRADLYFSQNKSSYTGMYGLDFTLKKNGSGDVKFRVASKSGVLVNATWKADGKLYLYYGDENAVGNNEYVVGEYKNDTLALNYFFDTATSKFSMWVDGANVVDSKYTYSDATSGVCYMRASLDAGNLISFELDNIRFYEAYSMTAAERVALDKAWLTMDKLVDANDSYYSAVGKISCDLTLPETGDNKTTIAWKSSNPEVISDDGKVSRTNEITSATLTATITSTVAGETVTDTKNFEFSVAAMEALTDEESVAKTAEYLTMEVLSPLDDPTDGIIRSLSLPAYNELHGCSVSWSSSNQAYITNSGRVIRPRYDEEDVEVMLTCTISRGECQKIQTYTFTVLKDQEFVDPEHMTDEEFFGVWDGSSWTTVGKFDYDYYGLEALEEAVKAAGTGGDYAAAKEALLDYFKNVRSQEAVMLDEESRNTLWANATIDGFQFIQNGKHCSGQMTFGTEWDSYTADLKLRDINAGATLAYNLQAWYNEDSSVEIARSNSEDESKRPRLELTVNGEVKTFYAVEDALIQSGSYADQNFSDAETLNIRTYGDFLDDGHTRALIKFNTGLTSEDVVTEARLILYGRTTGSGEEKTVFVGYEPDTTWSSDTITWNKIDGLVYSFNGFGNSNETDSGVSEAGSWEIMDSCIVNYPKQITRFDCWNEIALEYKLTGNEQYAYSALRIMEGFIRDRGGWTSTTTAMDLPAYPDPNGLRGGYATSLTASQRVSNWMDVLPVFLESEYATADFITALLKNLWDTGNFLTVYNSKSGNWRQTEMTALLDLGARLPELYDAQNGKNWHDMGRSALEELIFTNTFEDGSYQESTEAYGSGAVGTFAEFKEQLIALGTDTSEEYNERLQKFALYQALLYANDGSSAQYGDSADTTRKVDKFESIYKWFNDEELEYIVTYGASGKEPDWTSKCFYDSGVTTLRSDWSTNGTWIFTNVRGGGNHGHKDYNSIVLHAFGRRLLIDSGYFEYDATNDYTAYGKSSEGHNTVMINNTSQDTFFDSSNPKVLYGTIHNFFTNKEYDYLEQSTPNTPGYEHRRSITFIKSGLVIVSDLMTPEDTVNINNYKQLWHLPAESNYTVSAEDLTIRSAYESGGNIALAIAKDEKITVGTAPGWRSRTYGRVEDAPYAYFETNGAGIQTMDTVIMLTENDQTATVKAEKLESRENTTAMKFDMVTKDGSFTGYYLQSYDGEGGSFGPFSTDAHTAYVLLDSEGNVQELLLNEGTYIRYNESGVNLLEASVEQESLFADVAGSIVYLTGDAEALTSVKILKQKDNAGIYVNDTPYSYDIIDGSITNIGSGSISTKVEDDSISTEDDSTSTEEDSWDETYYKLDSGQITSPLTGDSDNLLLWLCLLNVFGCGVAAIAIYYRKRIFSFSSGI